MPKFLSLFSGCGGLDLGFSQAGYEGALSVDIDDAALSVNSMNLKHPIEKLDLTNNFPGIDPEHKIDVILAGSPCQGFSPAGLRKVDDPRNSLLFVAARVAEKIKPKVVIAENVPGALSGAHKVYWAELHDRFREQGYQTHDLHVDSSNFGVPQKRRRVLFIAWRTGVIRNFSFPEKRNLVLGDVLHNIDGVDNHDPVNINKFSSDYKIAIRIGQGQKLTNSRSGERSIHTWDIPEVFGRTNKSERDLLNNVLRIRRQIRRRDFGDADPVSTKFLVEMYGLDMLKNLVDKKYLREIGEYHDLTSTFNGKYRRLEIEKHSRTVDTRFGDYRLFLHPTENRSFTVREAARVQGFPDDFLFLGTTTQKFRMIGNAVPPPLAHSVAQLIKTFI